MKALNLSLLSLFFVTNVIAEPPVDKGFRSLFNGKDLTGWQYGRGKKAVSMKGRTETPDGRISVKDGSIVMNKGRGIRDLFTEEQFGKDFHLILEFKAGEKADSGVYIRGPQLQIRDFIRRGEQKQLTNFKNDSWNELDITVKGQMATCFVNSQKLRNMKIPPKGGIGLQAESGVFAFRNIRIYVAE